MSSFVNIGDDTINLDHVCSAKWNTEGVTVCLDNGGAIVLTGECADEFAVASGRKIETFDGPIEVPSKPENGLKELPSVRKSK